MEGMTLGKDHFNSNNVTKYSIIIAHLQTIKEDTWIETNPLSATYVIKLFHGRTPVSKKPFHCIQLTKHSKIITYSRYSFIAI